MTIPEFFVTPLFMLGIAVAVFVFVRSAVAFIEGSTDYSACQSPRNNSFSGLFETVYWWAFYREQRLEAVRKEKLEKWRQNND